MGGREFFGISRPFSKEGVIVLVYHALPQKVEGGGGITLVFHALPTGISVGVGVVGLVCGLWVGCVMGSVAG